MLGLMRQTECLYTGVITAVQFAIYNNADTKTCTECITDEVIILLGATTCLKFLIDGRQRAAQCLAIGKEVSIIINIYRDTKLTFKIRT